MKNEEYWKNKVSELFDLGYLHSWKENELPRLRDAGEYWEKDGWNTVYHVTDIVGSHYGWRMSFAFLEWAGENEGLTEESEEVFDATDEVMSNLSDCLPEGFFVNSDDGIALFYSEET